MNAGVSLQRTRGLAQRRHERLGSRQGRVAGVVAADHLDQLHQVRRVEEMQPQEAVAPLRGPGQRVDAEAGGVAGEDRRQRRGRVKLTKDRTLEVQLLRRCFDDQPGLRGFLQRGRQRERGVRRGRDRFAGLAAPHAVVDGRADLLQRCDKQVAGDVTERDLIACQRSGLGNAAAHGAAADDGNCLERWIWSVHAVLRVSRRSHSRSSGARCGARVSKTH